MDKRSIVLKEEYVLTPQDDIIMDSVFLFIFLVILISSLILVVNIYKLSRFKDIPMFMSVLAISLSLLFMSTYLSNKIAYDIYDMYTE